MIKLAEVTLENEMDVVLSGQKFLKITELLHLNLSTRSTFASAVSEVVRVMTEHTDHGVLQLGIVEQDRRQKLICKICYPADEPPIDPDLFMYAKKLVPFFDTHKTAEKIIVEFSIGLPKSLNLNRLKIQQIAEALEQNGPVSPYEVLKISKNELTAKAELQEAELRASKVMNELKSEFISMASHELKTPITILKAYGQLALSPKVKTVEQAQSIVAKMNAQCVKLSTLALQLLDSAKIEIGQLEYKMTPVDFVSYLHQTIEDLRHLIPHHTLVVDCADTYTIRIDQLRMEQVLSNLLSNAGKYSESGTSIHLCTKNDYENKLLIFSIKDEGIGISPDGITKIFQKFHREPEVLSKHSGLGMGMYIAAKIVDAHGGDIWVESTTGEGSTFHISLPFA
ncbi:sensor histidine kinase [Pedobacter sp. SAFR-022]|uniref:sensor histidine kinase n=1 Tax=Pedobacter sp. SAFR-022 TaxID=3436861 RepID=UPI003F81C750